jgi:hypothetical protein
MPGDLPHETHRSPQGPSYQLSLTIESKPTLSWSYSGVRIYSASPFGSRAVKEPFSTLADRGRSASPKLHKMLVVSYL